MELELSILLREKTLQVLNSSFIYGIIVHCLVKSNEKLALSKAICHKVFKVHRISCRVKNYLGIRQFVFKIGRKF